MPTFQYLYDFVSPNGFFVHKVLPEICGRTGWEVEYVPVFLGGIMKDTGNQPPAVAFKGVKGKLAYQKREIDRFAARHNISWSWSPFFPINTITVMRGAIYARGKDWERTYIDTMFEASWGADPKDIADPTVIMAILKAADLPADEIAAATQDPDVKADLFQTTADAVSRGVFGLPTLFVGNEMFFGKDSLFDFEEELRR